MRKCQHPTWKPCERLHDVLTDERYALMICCECYEAYRWLAMEKIQPPLLDDED